nr:TetR/AcrR family transcriptional regulator [Kineococcus aurantiacus]
MAATRSAETLSVAEIARAAGVHRSTFYEHSDSPSALLGTVLREELDDARERHLAGPGDRDWREALRATTLDVLEHLERHRAVYLRSLGSPADGTLRSLLSDHFHASILLLTRRGVLHSPVADPDLMARYVAEGTVGALSVWLGRDVRDPQAFLEAYTDLVPGWWPVRAGSRPVR